MYKKYIFLVVFLFPTLSLQCHFVFTALIQKKTPSSNSFISKICNTEYGAIHKTKRKTNPPNGYAWISFTKFVFEEQKKKVAKHFFLESIKIEWRRSSRLSGRSSRALYLLSITLSRSLARSLAPWLCPHSKISISNGSCEERLY